jgi:pimeloyl-ACP methyl ester carboxylesterase
LSLEPSDIVFDDCKDWNAGAASQQDLEPVISRIPTLIFTGKFDPVTPPEYARGVASHLENVQVIEFIGGHGALQPGANLSCSSKLFQAFLEQPVSLDESCSSRGLYWAGVLDDQPPASRPRVR